MTNNNKKKNQRKNYRCKNDLNKVRFVCSYVVCLYFCLEKRIKQKLFCLFFFVRPENHLHFLCVLCLFFSINIINVLHVIHNNWVRSHQIVPIRATKRKLKQNPLHILNVCKCVFLCYNLFFLCMYQLYFGGHRNKWLTTYHIHTYSFNKSNYFGMLNFKLIACGRCLSAMDNG